MKNRRRNKLPDSPFQFRYGVTIAGVVLVAVVVHAALIRVSLNGVLGEAGEAVSQRLLVASLATLVLGLPVAAVLGARILFPVAGPLARVRSHLRGLLDGEASGPLRLRRSDPLADVASMLNRLLECQSGGAGRVVEPPRVETSERTAEPALLDSFAPALPCEPEYEETPEYLM